MAGCSQPANFFKEVHMWNRIKKWRPLTLSFFITLLFCLLFLGLCLLFHGLADFYTKTVYIWISVPFAAFFSLLPFSMLEVMLKILFFILCGLLAVFAVFLAAWKSKRDIILKIGGIVTLTYLFVLGYFALSGCLFLGHFYHTPYFWIPFLTCLVLFAALIVTNRSRNPQVIRGWKTTLSAGGMIAVVLATALVATPALTSTISSQNKLEDRSFTLEELVNYTSDILDDMKSTYTELVLLCGSPAKVVFPTYDTLEEDLIASARNLGKTEYPALRGYYPPVRLHNSNSVIFSDNVVGWFSPGSCEILVKNSLRNSALPQTAAHEYAHYKGFLRESEAEYIGTLICLTSDNPWIRYSGCYTVFSRTLEILKSLDALQEYNFLVQKYNAIFASAKEELVFSSDNGIPLTRLLPAFPLDATMQIEASGWVSFTCYLRSEKTLETFLDSFSDIRKLDWEVQTRYTEGDEDFVVKKTLTLSSFSELLKREDAAAVLQSLQTFLDTSAEFFGTGAAWSFTLDVEAGFTREEKLQNLSEEIRVLEESLSSEDQIVLTLFLSHTELESGDTHQAFMKELQKEAGDMREKLSALSENTASELWFVSEGSSNRLAAYFRIRVPKEVCPQDHMKAWIDQLECFGSRNYLYYSVSSTDLKSEEELKKEQEEAEKKRNLALSAMNPVSYFTFTSSGSDYPVALRYLMERELLQE